MNDRLTVKELIEMLERVKNKNLPVRLEGCDCFGDAANIEEDEFTVDIMRNNLNRQ